MKILLLEDNRQLAESLGDYLAEKGFEVDYAYHAKSCINLVEKNDYDVLVMDIAMPGPSGLDACSEIRQRLQVATPIIFLTARDTLDDKIKGFKAGCDDYLVKPFSPDELICRLTALHLRGPRRDIGKIKLGPITLDNADCSVTRNGKLIRLHHTQFEILKLLVQHYPNPVSKEALTRMIWHDHQPDSDALRTHLYRLRSLIDKPFDQSIIVTVHNKGYRIEI